MKSPGEAATRRYVSAAVAIAGMAIATAADALYLRPGPLSIAQKAFVIILALLATYTHVSLRAEHVYYKRMVQNGCAPVPEYPNNPFGIPFLLETARALRAHDFLQLRVRQLNSIARTFRLHMFPETAMIIITDEPEIVKAVLSTKFDDWILPTERIKGFLPVLGAHSIFTTNAGEWQRSRATLRPAFVRDQVSDLQCFDKHITKLIKRIPTDGSRFDIQDLFSKMTIDSISDFMFGQTTDMLGSAPERDAKLGTYFDASMMKIAQRARLGWVTRILPDRELDGYCQFLRSYVDEFVEKRRLAVQASETSKGNKYVFLDELLKSESSNGVIRNQLLSIFLAGRDTTSSVLTYLFFELSRNPDVVAKIQQEIRELGEPDPSWEQLKNMKYLNWTVKEALRLNPPVPGNAREAVRDTILPIGGGPDGKEPVFVPKRSVIRYQVWAMHRREDIYGSDAEEFRPERWESLRLG